LGRNAQISRNEVLRDALGNRGLGGQKRLISGGRILPEITALKGEFL
jgi:hypothetical protein